MGNKARKNDTNKRLGEGKYSFPIVWLTGVLLFELAFISTMIITMIYSEEQVRTSLEKQVRLERLQGDILHLDELLTMSARMSAASGDLRWEDRYQLYEPKLEAAISEALDLLPSNQLEGLEETNIANEKLVKMEKQAFEAVRQGNKELAQSLLFSPVYEQAKTSYALGLNQRLQLLDTLGEQLIKAQKKQVRIIQFFGLLGCLLLFSIWYLVIKNIRLWQNVLTKTQSELQVSQQLLRERVHVMARELTRAELKERDRIAKLLHDELQQLLVAARLHTHMLPESPAKQQTESLIDDAITASRTLTVNLSPPELVSGGIMGGVDWLVKWMQDGYNLTVNLTFDGEPPNLEKEVEIVAFDSIRELLFNVVKHAQVSEAELNAFSNEKGFNVAVTDRGVGFDSEHALSRPQFGLQNTLRRVELIGGAVKISSAPDQGSSVTMLFPTIALSQSSPVRIVIVDDHEIVREGIRILIDRETDLSIVGEAEDLEGALDIVEQLEPDVVLMDISLGSSKSNGVEVTRKLRESQYDGTIIALTSYESQNHQRALAELNVLNYLIKGDGVHNILETIRLSQERM